MNIHADKEKPYIFHWDEYHKTEIHIEFLNIPTEGRDRVHHQTNS